MKHLSFVILLLLAGVSLFGQTGNTGTLKIFTELQGITVFVDENPQTNYQEIKNLATGTHYLRVMSGDTRVYGQIVTIVKDQVTSILIEQSNDVTPKQTVSQPVVQKPVDVVQPQNINKSGTLNIFSEITGISVFLNEIKQGDDIKTINSVPAGNHYLKAMKDGVSVFGELVTVNEGQTTTVLIKNDGQVAEKILSSKVAEQDEFKNKKLDVILSRGMTTTTKGYSDIYPGYYSYWGFSNSISTSTETTDWKIIQGGVKEISEREFASLVENKALTEKIDLQIKKDNKRSVVASLIALPCVIVATCVLTDMVGSKPWMHKDNPEHPQYETVAAAISIPVGTIAYLVAMKKPYSGHYTTVDNAAKDAQGYNRKLKEKLGLPENYSTGN